MCSVISFRKFDSSLQKMFVTCNKLTSSPVMYIKSETFGSMYLHSVAVQFSAVYLRRWKRFLTYIGYKLQTIIMSINNLYIFTFLQKELEIFCMFMGTQLISVWKINSLVFKESGYTLYFTCKLLNSSPQFLSSINCNCIDLAFQISSQQKSRLFKSGERTGRDTGASRPRPIQRPG
jgi:hypothetical protein